MAAPNPALVEARARGVIFDVGHGAGSFRWRIAVPIVKAGFLPDSISTDLHTSSMNAGMKDMLNVMSKFLALGMPLPDVIARSTWNPAQADPAGHARAPVGRRARRRRRAARRARTLRLPRHRRRAHARSGAIDLRADGARRRRRLRPQRPGGHRLESEQPARRHADLKDPRIFGITRITTLGIAVTLSALTSLSRRP